MVVNKEKEERKIGDDDLLVQRGSSRNRLPLMQYVEFAPIKDVPAKHSKMISSPFLTTLLS